MDVPGLHFWRGFFGEGVGEEVNIPSVTMAGTTKLWVKSTNLNLRQTEIVMLAWTGAISAIATIGSIFIEIHYPFNSIKNRHFLSLCYYFCFLSTYIFIN